MRSLLMGRVILGELCGSQSLEAEPVFLPLQSGTLAGKSVSLERLLIFYLEAFYLKTQCINSSHLLKGRRCTLSGLNRIQKE